MWAFLWKVLYKLHLYRGKREFIAGYWKLPDNHYRVRIDATFSKCKTKQDAKDKVKEFF